MLLIGRKGLRCVLSIVTAITSLSFSLKMPHGLKPSGQCFDNLKRVSNHMERRFPVRPECCEFKLQEDCVPLPEAKVRGLTKVVKSVATFSLWLKYL